MGNEVLWLLSLRRIFWAERNGRSFCYAAKIVVVFIVCVTRRIFLSLLRRNLLSQKKRRNIDQAKTKRFSISPAFVRETKGCAERGVNFLMGAARAFLPRKTQLRIVTPQNSPYFENTNNREKTHSPFSPCDKNVIRTLLLLSHDFFFRELESRKWISFYEPPPPPPPRESCENNFHERKVENEGNWAEEGQIKIGQKKNRIPSSCDRKKV